MAEKYAGAQWLMESRCPREKMSVHGNEVAEILGQVFQGLYHLPNGSLEKATWSHPHNVIISLPGDFATYDYNTLTRLVVLCHDRCVRLEIQPCNCSHLRLIFSARNRRSESSTQRHPTMEEAVDSIRKHIGLGVV